jgi:hypothetical protein
LKLLVPYLRTADDAIQRLSDRIYGASSDSVEPYVHTQNLFGWPEPRVFLDEGNGAEPGARTFERCLAGPDLLN